MRRMRWASIVLAVLLVAGVASMAAGQGDGSSFTIQPDYSYKSILKVYDELKARNQPQFVTTDVVLHAAHLLFDDSLRLIEIDKLHPLATELTSAMVGWCRQSDLQLAREVKAFFCVPAKILDPDFKVPADVAKVVAKDLALIEKHEGGHISGTLANCEDFSQYIPRGHYTRNEAFKRYFIAMMWYGRRMFRLEVARPDCAPLPAGVDPWTSGHKPREAKAALLITWMLHHVKVNGEPAIKTWDKLYIPTTLFAGRTEDLNPHEVRALAQKVWGALPLPTKLNDGAKLAEFIRLATAFTKPKIDSLGSGRKGFCFMAQRFTPDSYITQCLVTDADRPFGYGVPRHPLVYTGPKDPHPFTWGRNIYIGPPERRFMPRGLDVMAVFGCEEALGILKAEGDTAYDGYDKMLAFLRKDVGAMMKQRKAENLYYAWLYALQPMMKPLTSKHVPGCLRSNAWLRKQLATSLASWAELRHDTILYVKQSYTPAPRAMRRTPPCYLEPQPEVFRRIGAMVKKMETDLAALGVLPGVLKDKYGQFNGLCVQLAAIAEKELAGKPLSERDWSVLAGTGRSLQRITRLPPAVSKKIKSETDSHMALVADVHTDTNASVVLEEAVGAPFLLTVRMPVNGRTVALRGAVFSYYEFKHPMKDRLTDEKWQTVLGDPQQRPALPKWLPVIRNR